MELSLDHIPHLETLSIGNSSFVETTYLPQNKPTTSSSWYCMTKRLASVRYLKPPENKESIHPESTLSIHHCDRLKSIVIGAKSFYLYQSFQVHGMIGYICSTFDLRALESISMQGMNFVFVTDLALRGNASYCHDSQISHPSPLSTLGLTASRISRMPLWRVRFDSPSHLDLPSLKRFHIESCALSGYFGKHDVLHLQKNTLSLISRCYRALLIRSPQARLSFFGSSDAVQVY